MERIARQRLHFCVGFCVEKCNQWHAQNQTDKAFQQLADRTNTIIYETTQDVVKEYNIIRQQAADEFIDNPLFMIPWGHHMYIIDKCESVHEALFYVQKTIKNGWSRAMLMNYIDVDLYSVQGKAINNFDRLLPDVQSDLARETLKDPYNFDFLTLTENYKEKELEDALVANITKFLLELLCKSLHKNLDKGLPM